MRCAKSGWSIPIHGTPQIRDFVFLDSENVVSDFDPRICGATTVFPEAVYDVFHDFNNKMREIGKKGIICPSARHSQDYCIALFDDETNSVRSFNAELNVTLQLVVEDQVFGGPIGSCNPPRQKLHATMGHY